MPDGALLSGVGGFTLDRVAADVEAGIHRKAVHVVADHARGVQDCKELLSMLGLSVHDRYGPKPRRVELSTLQGVQLPDRTVRITRDVGSMWANPFIVGRYYRWLDRTLGHPWPQPIDVPDGVEPADPTLECCHSPELAAEWHRAWLPSSGLPISELVGRDIACWCRVHAPCHGDALLDAAWKLHNDRKNKA